MPLESNYGRTPHGYLRTLKLSGRKRPAVQVVDDATGELVYARRLNTDTFRPPVFADGSYTWWSARWAARTR